MLQQLQPVAGFARVKDVEAEAVDANCSRGKRVRHRCAGLCCARIWVLHSLQPPLRILDLLTCSRIRRLSSPALPPLHCPQGKMIKAAKAEALVRRVLHSTPPGLFQHMMRTINSQVLLRACQ